MDLLNAEFPKNEIIVLLSQNKQKIKFISSNLSVLISMQNMSKASCKACLAVGFMLYLLAHFVEK